MGTEYELIDLAKPSNQAVIQVITTTVSAFATIILAVLTSCYVRLTYHMLNEMRASRGPNLFIDIEPTQHGEFKLVVGNLGASAAYNIQFAVSDSIPWGKSEYYSGFKTMGIIKDGIRYLAPSRILKYTAGVYDWRELQKADSSAKFVVTFDDSAKKKNSLEFTFDMRQYKDVRLESFRSPEADIADALRKRERNRSSERRMDDIVQRFGSKNCPYCGLRISSSAKKCPHCLEFLESKENEA